MSSSTRSIDASRRPVTVPQIASSKVRAGSEPLVMVTAYDAPSSRVADEAGVDMILVGDSLAMVVLGYDDTLQVTVADMAHHVAAVARANPSALVIGDMPWMSYHVSPAETVRNAAELIRAGAGCVKLEGGAKRVGMVEAIVDAEIPVMGHIGLTPQSLHAMGGFKVQGRDPHAAETIREQDDATYGLFFLAGLGWALRGDMTAAHANLRLALMRSKSTAIGRHLPRQWWPFCTDLVEPPPLDALATYFGVAPAPSPESQL